MLIWIAALLSVPSAPAAAHAFLASSDPAANAVLPTAPPTVTLRFTEALEPSYSRADLFDQTGKQVPGATSAVSTDPLTLTVTLPASLSNGTYSLLWRTLSAADGHTAQGYLPFTVGTLADVRVVVPPVPERSVSILPSWALPATRWLALLGLAMVVAIWPVWLFVIRPAAAPVWQVGPKLTRRVRGYAVGAAIVATIANLDLLLAQALSITAPGALASGVTSTLTDTHFGNWWLIRMGLLLIWAVVVLGAAWWWPWRRRALALLGLVISAILPLPFAMTSHAGAEPQGQTMALASDYAHVLAASLWIGGLFVLVVALVPTLPKLTAAGRRAVLGRAIPRFSLLALSAWGVLGLTGIYAAWLQVGNLPALVETAYGQTLVVKLALIVPLLCLGAFNLLFVTRRLRLARTVEQIEGGSRHFLVALTAETVIVTLLLGVVGMLVGTPTARQVMEQEAQQRRIPLAADGQSASLILMPGTVGPNHYRLEVSNGGLQGARGGDATLRFELPDRQTGQIDVPLQSVPPGGYEAHGSELAFPGAWQIQATVRIPGQPDWVATATVPISTEPPPNQVPAPPPLFAPAGIAALLLMLLGIAGIAFAFGASTPVLRREAGGLGLVAISAGFLLLFQAQLPPVAIAAPNATASPVALDPVVVSRGQALFAQNCAACHGAGGKGDGPGGASLAIKPADLTMGHAMFHSDAELTLWITNGIDGTAMPAFGGKLAPAQITDVLTYIRQLQQPALLARDAPGPEACTVAPRTLDQIAALAKDPPQALPLNVTDPGIPLTDPAIQTDIKTTVREMAACANAGDMMRRLALYSDARIGAAYPDGPTRALQEMAKVSWPVPAETRVAIINIDDFRRLSDGRASASVTVDDPSYYHTHVPGFVPPVQLQVARMIFVQEGGSWRVDGTQAGTAAVAATPAAGTPAP